MRRSFDALFAQYDFLITPSAAAMPWPATESHPAAIDGQPLGSRGRALEVRRPAFEITRPNEADASSDDNSFGRSSTGTFNADGTIASLRDRQPEYPSIVRRLLRWSGR